MFCQKCGQQNPEGVNFCAACGAPLTPAPVPEAGQPAFEQPPVYTPPAGSPQQPVYAAPVYTPPQPAPKKNKKTALVIGGVIAGVVVLAIVLFIVAVYAGTADERALVGEWKGTVDMSDYLQEELSTIPEFGTYIEITDYSFDVTYKFNDDFTYSRTVDEDSVDEALENLKSDMKNAIYAYAEEIIRQNGLNVSPEELYALSGTSIDEIVDSSYDEDVFEELREDFFSEGNFEAEDGKLFTSDGVDYMPDPNIYETYELTDNQLILTDAAGPQVTEADRAAYPVTLERVGA